MVDHDRFQRLTAADDNSYYFEIAGDPVDLAEVVDVLELDAIDQVSDLIDRVLLLAEQLGLRPWSDSEAAPKVEECRGWDYFDEFMALPTQPFPTAGQ